MTKRLRVIAIVIGLLAVFSGNVSAYSEENLNVTIIEGNKKSTANLTEPVSVKKLQFQKMMNLIMPLIIS